MLSINTVDELLNQEIPLRTTVLAFDVPLEVWKSKFHSIVPLLMSDAIEALIVDDCHVQVLAEMVADAAVRVLVTNLGDHFICHGRRIPLSRFLRGDFVVNKVRSRSKEFRSLTRKFMTLKDILSAIKTLHENFPDVEDLLENAMHNISRQKEAPSSVEMVKVGERKRKCESGENEDAQKGLSSTTRKKCAPRDSRLMDQLAKMMKKVEKDNKAESSEEEITLKVSSCYICKAQLKVLRNPAGKERLCETCNAFNAEMRRQRTDLKGRYAVVTGGRIKIGYQTALMLLRDGCYVVVTTRFPNDAVARFSKESDFSHWHCRLKVYPLDLLSARSTDCFVSYVKANLPFLDILINNAAQTISRPASFYRHLLPGEHVERTTLPENQRNILVHGVQLQYTNQQEELALHPSSQEWPMVQTEADAMPLEQGRLEEQMLDDVNTFPTVELVDANLLDECPVGQQEVNPSGRNFLKGAWMQPSPKPRVSNKNVMLMEAESIAGVSLVRQSLASNATERMKERNDERMKERNDERMKERNDERMKERNDERMKERNDERTSFPVGALDSDGQQVDLRKENSWVYTATEVPMKELVEVLTINTLAPFLLVTKLKDTMKKSPNKSRFIVNVSAMEGQFSRKSKTMFHPHTNMAKAALNMLTRTSGLEYARDNIFMTAVDTGWVTNENPLLSLDEKRPEMPLDCVDGAARVYHPIVHGLKRNSKPFFAVFIKDYKLHPW